MSHTRELGYAIQNREKILDLIDAYIDAREALEEH